MKKVSARLQRLNLRSLFARPVESAPTLLPYRGSFKLYRFGRPLRYAKDGINYGVSVAVLLLMVLGLGLPWWLGLGVGLMVFSGLFFLLNIRPPREQEQVDLKGEVQQKLRECTGAIERLRAFALQMPNAKVQARLAIIGDMAAKLVEGLWANPNTTLTTGTRFQFLLAETTRLVETCLRVQDGRICGEPEKLQAFVSKVEDDLLPQLQTALRDFAVKLDQSELLSLEATLSVVESTLKLEGLS